MNEIDPFQEYYEGARRSDTGQESVEQLLARMEANAAKIEKDKKLKEDANTIRGPLNAFIKTMNSVIGKIIDEESQKGTRADLIVTLVMGGMAFTLANVLYLFRKILKSELSDEEFKVSFLWMFETAMKDISKKNGGV